MKKSFRSSCPISSTLDLLGDKWSLVIVRDMLLFGKQTFKEFSQSQEGIATGILASRLKKLELFGLITKRKLPENQKENIYLLTKKGVDLAPLIVEVAYWGDKYMPEYNLELLPLKGLKADKASLIKQIQNNYNSIFEKTIR